MSLFLANPINDQEINEVKLSVAKMQLNAQSEVYRNAFESCLSRCIPDYYSEGELNKGETVCTDRCVAKFVKANMIIFQQFQYNRLSDPNNLPAYQSIPKSTD